MELLVKAGSQTKIVHWKVVMKVSEFELVFHGLLLLKLGKSIS